ncbi:hypothetical protein BJ741DRAFT_665958 [Chytriomyces cf. hyalinus JEL632]|nr:hypothetical protein BJ741DRAFT_665958 [Chytriomyces cf. hyalinus JEL632]
MHTYNRIVRCKRCATLHTHCDKTWPTCRRCTDAGVPCNYRATKLTGFPCDRCTALHKKCSKDEEGGCSRCRRAGQQCVYVPAILKHQQLTEAEAEAVEQAESVTPPSSINWNNAPTAEDPITPTTSLAKVCNDYYYSGSDEIPDCFRPTQKQSAVLKKAPETLVSPATRLPTMTTAIIGRMPKQQQSPTFKEWMLVHAYIHSHDERVQQHLAHYILDKAAFTVEFVFQPSALW